MKRIIVLLLIIVNQHAFSQGSKFGVVAGLNYSSITGDITDFLNIDRRISFQAGVFAEFSLSEKFAFNPEIIYSSQGFRNDINITNIFDPFDPDFNIDTNLRSAIRANYLNIPLLFKYYITRRFGVLLGPQIGFLLNTSSVLLEGNPNFFEEDSVSGNFEFDYGASVGISFLIIKSLEARLSYYQGLRNINSGTPLEDFSKDFNSVFSLTARYTIF